MDGHFLTVLTLKLFKPTCSLFGNHARHFNYFQDILLFVK